MKKTYFIAISLLLLVILLVSCSGGTERGYGKKASVVGGEFITGTRGVDLKLEDPGTLTVPLREPAFFVVIAENLGNKEANLQFLISGADKKFIEFDQPEEKDSLLKGKTRYGKGDQGYFSFLSKATDIADVKGIKLLSQPTTVNVCYPYETFIQIPVKINLRPEINKLIPSEYSIGTSQGQGAPVGINSLKMKSYRRSADATQVALEFELSQFDRSNGAEVYIDDSGTANPCGSAPDVRKLLENKNHVVMSDVKVSNLDINCPSLEARKNLPGSVDFTRTPVVTCMADLKRGSYPGDELNTVVTAKLKYKMKHSLVKNIIIENLDEYE